MMDSKELSDLLRKRELRATPTRLDVLSLIAASENAVPYSQIQDSLQSFDRVTLYRTLNSLIEKGILHKALVNENDTYYALCSNNCDTEGHNHQHIHFKCNACLEVMCLQTSKPFFIALNNYKIEEVEVYASGICEKCGS